MPRNFSAHLPKRCVDLSGSDSYADPIFEQAARQALEHWPVQVAELKFISQSENIVFKVRSAQEENFVLRLHRPGYNSLAQLQSERVWTAALNDAGISAPVGVPASSGEQFIKFEDRYAGMLHWSEGTTLQPEFYATKDARTRRDYLEELGRLIARMHEQASAWTPPQGFERRNLDTDGLVGEAPSWGRFWEVPEMDRAARDRLSNLRKALQQILSGYEIQARATQQFSLIHADLHFGNVIRTGNNLHVIDFDDTAFGFHAFDLAVAINEFQTLPEYDEIADALITGYSAVRPSQAEKMQAWLPTFHVVRTCSILGWLHDRPEMGRRNHFTEFSKIALNAATKLGYI